MPKQYTFNKENGSWYIDLPEYLDQGGSKGDLQMVSGADTMLDIVSNGRNSVTVEMETSPFPGSDELILTEKCDPVLGGGYYNMQKFEDKVVNQDMWLCDVTRFVFGDIPLKIYVKRIEG